MAVNTQRIVRVHNAAISVESMPQTAAVLYVGILEGSTPRTAAVRNAGILACDADGTRACTRRSVCGSHAGLKYL